MNTQVIQWEYIFRKTDVGTDKVTRHRLYFESIDVPCVALQSATQSFYQSKRPKRTLNNPSIQGGTEVWMSKK